MTDPPPKILPLGESAIVVEFGTEISESFNSRSIALADYLETNPFPGFLEAIPAYASTTIFFDLRVLRYTFSQFRSAFDAAKHLALAALEHARQTPHDEQAVIEIPATFNSNDAPDLEFVSGLCGASTDDVVDIFTAAVYRVYMIGFLPGFAYMGEVDERIRVPRKQQPRLKVPKGSVGIAGRQTGVYPLESPGGWQVIGRTDVEFFTPHRNSPSLLKAGDLVRFVAI